METNPRVSVIIISQGQKEALRASLSALAAAGVRTVGEGEEAAALWEVLVVDCGSPDGSSRLDEEFEGVTFLRLPRNFGWTRAFNIATRTAKGEYLFSLPTGLMVEPDTIGELVRRLEADSQAGALCPAGKFYALPRPGEDELREVPASQAEYPFRQAVLYPKLTLASINFFPAKYGQNFADLELFYKMKEAGKKVGVAEDLSLRGEHQATPLIDAESEEVDRLHGLATFYGKNYGAMAGLSFRLGKVLGAALRFRFGTALSLLSGTKVDGL